ncbi:MAG TPA: class I SAM-dependent methyltransferase [Planctomycetota bacterium]|nr:class I SAM-dependent methyltransferase [Planctomycetota bacterium]
MLGAVKSVFWFFVRCLLVLKAVPLLRRLFFWRSRDTIHSYWKNPGDAANEAKGYLEGEERSRFLVEKIREKVPPPASVLEIGCNVGRNLNALLAAGYDVHGIEISAEALKLMKEAFPQVAEKGHIVHSPVEDVIRTFPENGMDVVFTMAVLEHIHTESEWIFGEMARIAKRYVVVLENEVALSWRHFPRNYGKIFQDLGLTQVWEHRLTDVPGLGDNYFGRIFEKPRPKA